MTPFASPAAMKSALARPRNAGHDATAQRHAALIAAACRHIETAPTPPSLAELAARAGLSRHHFHRLFKTATGLTPLNYAHGQRAQRLRQELQHGASITAAIYDAGFPSNSRFYEAAGGLLGMRASAYRNGGDGSAIRFAIGQCSLGAILVACSARGVCAISLGDDPNALAQGLQDRFPKAELVGADADFERLVAQVVGLVETPRTAPNLLPLDIRGSVFQQRVWRALQRIPVGTTRSYAQLAADIGEPTAARAVARACATNPLAIAIPCHRIVRSDGALSGYRWGVERKRELLRREREDG